MRTDIFLKGAIGALALSLALPAGSAYAEDSIYVPLFTYRTGPFAGSGTPIADGMHDYLTMLNERDGGIGGVKLIVDECETGYDTKKGLECYDAVKPKNPVIVNPWSTGITLSLIPKASVDKIPILSMAYGLSASAKGDIFPWVFNPPATYWDGLSEILKYAGGGSIDALKGKTIGYLYFDAGFGREPMPLFQSLAKEAGFELKLYPVAPADMQNQSAQWLDIRRDKPDVLVIFGWGAMNPTAIKEAVKDEFPTDKFVSIWWPNDADAASAGDGAKGFKMLNWHGTGAELSGLRRHPETGHRRRQEPDAEVRSRRSPLQSRRLQCDADRRGDRRSAEDHRQEGGDRRGRAPGAGKPRHRRGAPEGARPRRLCRIVQDDLRRSQQPFRDLCPAVGRREVGQGQRSHHAGFGQGAAAHRRSRQGLRREERRLARAHRGVRQQVSRQAHPLPQLGWGRQPGASGRTPVLPDGLWQRIACMTESPSSTSSTSRSSTIRSRWC